MLLILWGAVTFRLKSVSEDRTSASRMAPPNEDTGIQRLPAVPIPNLKKSQIQDTFDQTRDGTRRHEAIDIIAPRGTPVLAVDDGTIRKLFTSRQGGLTIYQFDSQEVYCYYYAHLEHYADGLQEGMRVRPGQPIAYVGSSGNAHTPHLHFAVFKLGQDKHWWHGTAVNPYPALMRAAGE